MVEDRYYTGLFAPKQKPSIAAGRVRTGLLALILPLGTSTAYGDIEGTWRVREPLQFEVAGETCAVRQAVAYVDRTGSRVEGRYEARVSCWSVYSPDADWESRQGTLQGTLEGSRLEATLTIGYDFQLELTGTLEGRRLVGAVMRPGDGSVEWSATRLGR